MSQQFEESAHPRERTGKFTTKVFAEADGGVDSLGLAFLEENAEGDFGAPATTQGQQALADAGIEVSHEATLHRLRLLEEHLNDPEVADTAQEMLRRTVERRTKARYLLNTKPQIAAAITPTPDWRDEAERLDVVHHANEMLTSYATRYDVQARDIAAQLVTDRRTLAEEMNLNCTRNMEDDPRPGASEHTYSWHYALDDAVKTVKRRGGTKDRQAKRAAQDLEWAQRGHIRCDRCDGEGGSRAWRDYVCYECGGHQSVPAEKDWQKETIAEILDPPTPEELSRREAEAAKARAEEAAAEEATKQALYAKVDAYVATDPALGALMSDENAKKVESSYFLLDMHEKVFHGLTLTERQMAAVRRTFEVGAQGAATKAPVPSGKTEVTGKVTSTKWDKDFRGNTVLKMRVEHEDGWAVWGTVPRKIEDQVEAGTQISFTAEVDPSRDDRHFGFFKRPSKAKVLGEIVDLRHLRAREGNDHVQDETSPPSS